VLSRENVVIDENPLPADSEDVESEWMPGTFRHEASGGLAMPMRWEGSLPGFCFERRCQTSLEACI
jgi:hypothetical protein